MLDNHGEVLEAIELLLEVEVTFFSKEDNNMLLSRRCAPMDYGPSRRMKVPEDRYHLWDFESDSGRNHTLSLPTKQIKSVRILDSRFDPSDFVTWEPNWFISRSSWGRFN